MVFLFFSISYRRTRHWLPSSRPRSLFGSATGRMDSPRLVRSTLGHHKLSPADRPPTGIRSLNSFESVPFFKRPRLVSMRSLRLFCSYEAGVVAMRPTRPRLSWQCLGCNVALLPYGIKAVVKCSAVLSSCLYDRYFACVANLVTYLAYWWCTGGKFSWAL